MISAKVSACRVKNVLKVLHGSVDLAGFAKTFARTEEHRMNAIELVVEITEPVEGALVVADERFSVGAQGLGQGGVTLRLGPGSCQGRGREYDCDVAVRVSHGVAGGALYELMDLHGPMGDVGAVLDQVQAMECT